MRTNRIAKATKEDDKRSLQGQEMKEMR